MTAPVSVMPIVGSGVFELCIFNPQKKPDYVGYFDDIASADKYIAEHQQYDIYLTPQILNPTLIQRAHNKMIKASERTKDSDVLGYKYLLCDLDPRQKLADGRIVDRPRGVSASDDEHTAALVLARRIITKIGLKDENYLLVDSGNGAHIYIPIESGIQEPAIIAALKGIETLYATELVAVDTSVGNPARLMRAPGSVNCKGAIKRPCTYLNCPEHLMPVGYEFIAGLKVDEVKESTQQDGTNLAERIAEQIGYIEKKREMYVLKECPFCHSTNKAAVVGRVGADGGYFFKCHHNRCKNKKWPDIKEQVGLATSRLDAARNVLKKQGAAALEIPEFQNEISRLKAMGDLPKLETTCKEVGIEYKALQKAARKPFAIAQDMADGWIAKHHIKTDRITRDIFYYKDGIYVDATDFVAGLIDDKFRGINTSRFINDVLDYIKRHSLFDFKDEWLGIENGLINPNTLEIVGPGPDKVTRIKLNVKYDPSAKSPKWIKFVDECKSDSILLQEAAGYPLLPHYPHAKAIMLLGNGGQGKSVFLRVVSEILGIENVSATSLQSLIENRFASSDLYGRLANIAGDISDMALSDTSIFKNLTGDDRVRAERKGQIAFEYWNRAKLMFSANQLAPTKDKTAGYMRRWILIDFLREMVQKPNIHLAAELLEERSGIFNWMLEGARRVNNHGFTYTHDPDEMAKRYIERSEPVVEFLEECCKENFDGFVPSQELANAYNVWARIKRRKKMSNKAFVGAMRGQNVYLVEYHKKTSIERDEYMRVIDTDRPWGFTGIDLVKNAMILAEEDSHPKEGYVRHVHHVQHFSTWARKKFGEKFCRASIEVADMTDMAAIPPGVPEKPNDGVIRRMRRMVANALNEKLSQMRSIVFRDAARRQADTARRQANTTLGDIDRHLGMAEERRKVTEAHTAEQAAKYGRRKVRIIKKDGYRTQVPLPDNPNKFVDHLYNLGDCLEVDAVRAKGLVERGVAKII